jgi:SAM-dependent methyltransferase
VVPLRRRGLSEGVGRLDRNASIGDDVAVAHTWSPDGYAHHAAFVPALGASILERLAPASGERILDLGCGDGTLTAKLVERGAVVHGVDASADMAEAARARGLNITVMDATRLTFQSEFDAVFSNAVLHWIHDADAVLAGVHRALVSGGRFVAEFGGHTNIAAIATAIRAVLHRHGLNYTWPWYYPSAEEYAARLEANGFHIEFTALFPRPTLLPTGMAGWLATFAGSLLDAASTKQRPRVEQEIVDLLKPSLCDASGNWTADYVRLQVAAKKV